MQTNELLTTIKDHAFEAANSLENTITELQQLTNVSLAVHQAMTYGDLDGQNYAESIDLIFCRLHAITQDMATEVDAMIGISRMIRPHLAETI